ncbi:Serine/threonine-protein kinase PrkC [Aquisphaera giovannonii]|uniref:Serine/threonine-protein kinase PrkC n=1 Tax=Aquisphaera giovannonii TaxID=406548 RepID=A0A5B9VYC2_9BACT|nr:serine/threonine-protein kinase [Aquisphaera giovannonii]QEH32987.1 Serine/threonine-protein kinase PrkC [Aquisphaera giovannonii]
MATSDRPKSRESPPADLVATIRASGVLPERLLDEIRARMVRGEYPTEPSALAERLTRDGHLTQYQTRRLLAGKPHGMLVGRYIILDRIGSGSMGRVYKAHHQMMDRVVALKIIAPEIASNEKVVARFQREMKLVGRLDHPNVVRAFDADQINKVLYIVMEYVPGQSLGDRLRQGPIPAPEMFEYAAQAAMGLAHAHSQGMVHRDIKPSNILVTDDRRVKILDLGLGVLMEADDHATFATADGIAVGTVDYMSPEQALGREVDGRSDLFSLGCAMFHLMTGKLAFPGDNPIDRLGRRLNSKPTPITDHIPDFPSSAGRVLEKLMALKPADRFSSAAEAAEALQAVIRPRSKPSPAARPTPAGAAAEPSRKAAPGAEPIPAPLAAIATSESAPPAAPLAAIPARPFPGWFAPLARLAERSPAALLMAFAGALAFTFGVGVGLGYLLK